jgi:hypothetical protein
LAQSRLQGTIFGQGGEFGEICRAALHYYLDGSNSGPVCSRLVNRLNGGDQDTSFFHD